MHNFETIIRPLSSFPALFSVYRPKVSANASVPFGRGCGNKWPAILNFNLEENIFPLCSELRKPNIITSFLLAGLITHSHKTGSFLGQQPYGHTVRGKGEKLCLCSATHGRLQENGHCNEQRGPQWTTAGPTLFFFYFFLSSSHFDARFERLEGICVWVPFGFSAVIYVNGWVWSFGWISFACGGDGVPQIWWIVWIINSELGCEFGLSFEGYGELLAGSSSRLGSAVCWERVSLQMAGPFASRWS